MNKIDSCLNELDIFCKKYNIPESHGINHAKCVLNHSVNAINELNYEISELDKASILLASILHDVDDRKYFNSKKYENAIRILNVIDIYDPYFINNTINMIDMVSCSKNGNNIYNYPKNKMHCFIPRWSDRLEAIGDIGVKRCYLYSCENNEKMYSNTTPIVENESEIWEIASEKRFKNYQNKNFKSSDMITHYYDKLLFITKTPDTILSNSYFIKKFKISSIPLVDICLMYDNTLESINNIKKYIEDIN